MTSKFAITHGKGFQITFPNGYTISVQFGTMNYCDNRSLDYPKSIPDHTECANAEVAVFNPTGEFIRGWPHANECDDVAGWLTVDQVFEIMQWVKGQ